jgi:hypothetical protein
MVSDVKTAAGLAMSRRVALTGGVLAGVTALAMPGGAAQTLAGAAPVARALTDRLQGTLHGIDLEKLADLMHPAVRTIAWTGSTELDVVGPSAYLAGYLTPYLRENPQFQMTVTNVLSNGIELIAFYDVSALVDGKTSAWSGCNVYLTDGERIVEQWVQQDLWWRSRSSPTVNSRIVMEQVERNFKEETTAANLAGMGLVTCYKNTMMPAPQRMAVLIPLLASDAVQTFWQPEGIAFFPDPHAIEINFEQTVLATTLNFWETVRRVVIIGNAIALLQAPSGNVTLANNQQKFCAWYNCDFFFFEAEKIKYLLFQEDIMYRRSQVRI